MDPLNCVREPSFLHFRMHEFPIKYYTASHYACLTLNFIIPLLPIFPYTALLQLPLPTTFPAPPPQNFFSAGVKCGAFPQSTCRIPFNLPQDPKFAIDHKTPIEINWPPDQRPCCDEVDTGPRPDLLALIPDQIVPQQVSTLHVRGVPAPLAHPLCPDSSVHMRIEPKAPVKMRIRMPEEKCPIRGPPCREWRQCVENTLINDQVRRPLARCCHRRPLPPLVIPVEKLEQLKARATEKECMEEERRRRMDERECERLKSRERQGKWNYTVEVGRETTVL
jgi:hypothetical protein